MIVDAADARKRIGQQSAVAAACAVGYVGAGTVEFIVDEHQAVAFSHFFLEMNTRLQVEHPVTECVTGLDLVEWQLRVAAGEPLPLRQGDIRFAGHAIEARPTVRRGSVRQASRRRPAASCTGAPRAHHAGRADAGTQGVPPGLLLASVRIDDGIAEGGIVSPFYDAMVAKVIVHGRDRADALRRLGAALEDTPLLGPRTNGRYLRDLARHPEFVAGAVTTKRLDDWAARRATISTSRRSLTTEDWVVAAALRARRHPTRLRRAARSPPAWQRGACPCAAARRRAP